MFGKSKELESQLKIFKIKCKKLSSYNFEMEEKIKQLEEIIAEQKKEIENLKQNKDFKPLKNTFPAVSLTEEQQNVMNQIKTTSNNLFITGKAGTGKSTLLKELVRISDPKTVAVVAYTGAAALNVGGQTIHTFFQLSIEPQETSNKDSIAMPSYVSGMLSVVNTLIIDEISMVRSDVLDMMDKKMQKARNNDQPFGGCRIIAFGDLYQLAPIAQTKEENAFIRSRYKTLYFFGAPAAETFKIIELQNVLRQNDQQFIFALNEIRLGHVSSGTLAYINNNGIKQIPEDWMRLTLKKDVAREINQYMLDKIKGKEVIYKTTVGGINPPTNEETSFDYDLHLKVGARVMAVMNDISKRYVNGSMGTVVELKEDSVVVNFNGVDIPVGKMICEKRKYTFDKTTHSLSSEITGWASQLPLRLGYAMTVHKAQGQTFDKLVLDFNGCNSFSAGQTYVALSRCKSISGLRLTREIKREDIFINDEVTAYLNGSFRQCNNISSKTTTSSDWEALNGECAF